MICFCVAYIAIVVPINNILFLLDNINRMRNGDVSYLNAGEHLERKEGDFMHGKHSGNPLLYRLGITYYDCFLKKFGE